MVARWNEAARWGFFIIATFAAGVRSVPGYDDWPEIVCVCLLFAGFLLWALGLYIYMWVRVIQQIRELRGNQRISGPTTSTATSHHGRRSLPASSERDLLLPAQGDCSVWRLEPSGEYLGRDG
jgi:hypothetical protein